MNQSLDKALYYLTGNGNFSTVTTEDLEKLVNEHPYFPVAQFLLAKKLKDKNDPRFLPQVQKTALYFPNPYWLHYQLLNNLPDEPIIHDNNAVAVPVINEQAHDEITHEEKTATEQALPVVGVEQNLVPHTTTEGIITSKEEPAINVEPKEEEHPITTVFTKDELESASNLAHETLQEVPEDGEQEKPLPLILDGETSTADTAMVKRESILPTILANEEPQEAETTPEAKQVDEEHFPETFVDETLQFSEIETPDEEKQEVATSHLKETEAKALEFQTISGVGGVDEEHFPETFIDETLRFSEIEEPDEETQQTVTSQLDQKEAEPTVAENPVIQLPAETATLTEEVAISKNDVSSDTKLEEIETPSEVLEPAHETASQPEEEMAAITRYPDETTEHFLEELDEPTTPEVTTEHQSPEAIPIEQVASTPEVPTLTEVETTPENHVAQREEIDEHEKMFRNIKAMLDASAEEANADTKDAPVPIDPYYTIDYFASQGIKLDLDKNPDDKLGKQVKKFTQWLKHMKKLGPEDAIPAETISQGEIEAQQIADSSNKAREVVTEAMALVLEKQGKNAKAIELYKKLSFLNPHKNAYFADKIKNLNGF
jgi:hypothetical protein